MVGCHIHVANLANVVAHGRPQGSPLHYVAIVLLGCDCRGDLHGRPVCRDFRHFAPMFAEYAAFRCTWALVVERALRATPLRTPPFFLYLPLMRFMPYITFAAIPCYAGLASTTGLAGCFVLGQKMGGRRGRLCIDVATLQPLRLPILPQYFTPPPPSTTPI
jgi:hypothetical protein